MMRQADPARVPSAAGAERGDGRFVLLAGTARSGTTWLGNILNSSPRSIYRHEPLLRLAEDEIAPLLKRVRRGSQLSPDERRMVLREWSKAYTVTHRAPFFKKEYRHCPPWLEWSAWLAVHFANRGYTLFRKSFTPPARGYDLVAKQGGMTSAMIEALTPDQLIVIMRHPCAVVASVRRGQRLGLMNQPPGMDNWVASRTDAASSLGFEARELENFSEDERIALDWLIENTDYLRLAERHSKCRVVVYEQLCANPLTATQELFDFLDWPVTQQTRRFIDVSTRPRGSWWRNWITARDRYFSVFRSSTQAVDAWRRELPLEDQLAVMRIAQRLLEHYWPDSDKKVTAAAHVAA